MTCRSAIERYWPQDTRSQALFVLTKENGSELPGRVSPQNADVWHSRDHGCLQINDHWHYGTKGWTRFDDIYDPSFNIRFAVQIHESWNSWGAWSSVCTNGRPKYEGIKCK